MSFSVQTAQDILEEMVLKYRGPGGCAAILKDGQIVAQNIWGYANIEERLPMESNTLMPICSITKQMLCMIILGLAEAAKNPSPKMKLTEDFYGQLTRRLHELLPSNATNGRRLTIDHLCDMHSGLRDYWSLCTLWGSYPESTYSISEHNATMLSKMISLHFQPGDQFSYANTNFNLLARLVEEETQNSLENLLAEYVFGPAQMTTAQLWPDNAIPLPQCCGYEGTLASGFISVTNNIEWAGDAGVAASLNDMIAYEKYFDQRYTNTQDQYCAMIQPHKYTDGTVSSYRHGLSWENIAGVTTVGHGGALRGYRLHRRYAIDSRVSVIIMFNHEADAEMAASFVIEKLLGRPQPVLPIVDPSPSWFGHFFDGNTHTVITVSQAHARGAISITDELHPLNLVDSLNARSQNVEVSISTDGDMLRGFVKSDNRIIAASRIKPGPDSLAGISPEEQIRSLIGTYHSNEVDSTFHIEGIGKNLYGMFDGFLGKGPPHLMTHLGSDVWVLVDQRAVDAPAPGNWTVSVGRGAYGSVVYVEVGCWLARSIQYFGVAKHL